MRIYFKVVPLENGKKENVYRKELNPVRKNNLMLEYGLKNKVVKKRDTLPQVCRFHLE